MLILAINTATGALGVGLARAGDQGQDVELLAEVVLAPADARSGHSERLMPAIAWAAETAGVGPADIGGVAVVAGPGGFTGVRTGLAAAKAIAQSRRIPVWGLDTLEVLAASFAGSGLVAPLLDARRGEVFAALYRRTGAAGLDLVRAPALAPMAEWLAALGPAGVAFVGEGAQRHAAAITDFPAAVPVPPEAHLLRPQAAARLAAPHLAAGGEDPVALAPRYHRAPAMAPGWVPGAGM